MKKLLPICLLLLLYSDFALGQMKEIDSLKAELIKPSLKDTTKIKLYLLLLDEFEEVSADSVELYVKKAKNLSFLNDEFMLANIYRYQATYFTSKSVADSARYYLDKSLKLLDKSNNASLRTKIYGNYSASYQIDNDLKNMAKYNLAAIKSVKNDDELLGRLYYNQGIINGHAELIDDSKKYFKLAYDLGAKTKYLQLEGMAAKGLGHIYMVDKKLDSSKFYLDRGVAICDQTDNPRVCYEVNYKIGELYDKLNNFKAAEISFKRALAFAERRNANSSKMAILSILGQHELRKKNFEKAVIYFNDFDALYKKYPEPSLRIEALKDWAKSESSLNNFNKSTALFEEYIHLKDSLYSVENRQAITYAEAKYQSEKKDKEIAEQKLSIADQQLSIQESNSKTRTMTILIVSLLLGSILLWFSFRQRQKRMQQQLVAIEREQEVRTLESLMEGEEKERLRIAKELHDGVNGDLSAIKFKLVSMLETNNQVINEAVAMIDNSCEQVRSISHNLVPPSLRDFDLLEAVETYCDDMNAIHKPEITFQHLGDTIVLEKKQEANIFRIIQELVTNSIKHAEAKEILVQLSNVENNPQLTIEDDGKGFDIDTAKSDGIGMQNIRSRVAYLDGDLDIKSDTKGTSFIISLNDNTKNT